MSSQAPVEYPDVPERNYETGQLADGTEIRYHRVTAETAGTVFVPGGTRQVGEGDILVPGPSGDVFSVLDEETLQGVLQKEPEDESQESETVPEDESQELPDIEKTNESVPDSEDETSGSV
jgi:hypothetical protein